MSRHIAHAPEQENTDPTKPQGIAGSLRILVPEKSMKLIIGPSGEHVKRIGGETGTFVNVSSHPFSTNDMCTDHIVSITPRFRVATFPNALSQCTHAMKAVMQHAFPTNDPTNDYKCIFLVDAALAGLMIGKSGDRISNLRREFNVQVSLQKPPNGQHDEEVTFSGSLEAVQRAVNQLNDVFKIYYHDEPESVYQQQSNGNGKGWYGNNKGGSGPGYWDHPSAVTNPYAGSAVKGSSYKGAPGQGKPDATLSWDARASGTSYPANYGSLGGVGGSQMTEQISSCPGIPIKQQLLRGAVLYLPAGMDPAAFIGKNGSFMKELKSRCCVHGVGYIKRMHIEPCDPSEEKNLPKEEGTNSSPKTSVKSDVASLNRIDFLASEGIFPYAIAQILERFRTVEKHMNYYEGKTDRPDVSESKNSTVHQGTAKDSGIDSPKPRSNSPKLSVGSQ